MAAKKTTRAKSRKNIARAKATRTSSVRSARKAPRGAVRIDPAPGSGGPGSIEIW